jgi:hypothetical protein
VRYFCIAQFSFSNRIPLRATRAKKITTAREASPIQRLRPMHAPGSHRTSTAFCSARRFTADFHRNFLITKLKKTLTKNSQIITSSQTSVIPHLLNIKFSVTRYCGPKGGIVDGD